MNAVEQHAIRVREVGHAKRLSIRRLEKMMDEGAVTTACPHRCRVEPDGKCPHGYRSPLLIRGIV